MSFNFTRFLFGIFLFYTVTAAQPHINGNEKMNWIAEEYIKLVLEVGLYIPNYVDAYFGPKEWEPAENAKKEGFPYKDFSDRIDRLSSALAGIDEKTLDKVLIQRKRTLGKQLNAVKANIEMTNGAKYSFDEESQKLYDAVAPEYSDEYFQEIINKLDKAIPGEGSITDRWSEFKKEFKIPEDKTDDVFKAAVAECRKRTLKYFDLPENENYTIEYVKGTNWGGYNWYKGNSHSLMQVNMDFPVYINRAVDLAAHEGYPGHHVRNIMLDQILYRKNGWAEYCVNLLFNPLSPIDEGTANFGIEVAFPGKERMKFEKEVLFPIAGIDTTRAEMFYQIQELMDGLGNASVEAARKYINGALTLDETAEWLSKFNLSTVEKAKNSMRFIETYRSYIINYTVGLEIVRKYIESNGGSADNPEKRWQLFKELISTPHSISDLVNGME